MAFLTFAYTVVFIFVCTIVVRTLRLHRPYRGPAGTRRLPGPKGLPLIGNLHQIPATHSWLQFKAWAAKYGPIYSISIAGRTQVIVSTEKIANDLLRERGSFYSSREQTVMGAHLLSDNLRPVLLPYGDVWRKGRRVAQSFTSTTVAPSYEPIQSLESLYCIHGLLRSPQNYERLFDRYAASVILRLTYGQKVETGNEEVVKRIFAVNHHLERIASPGSYLVDTFPSLNLLPSFLAPWKREGHRLHDEELDLFMSQLYSVKASMDAGTAPPCFARSWWETQEKSGLTDPQAAYVLGTLFEAGAGTSKAALCSFLLALIHYPHWQTRMHAEVNEVVGTSRLPDFSDLPHLPTVRACMKETLRWRPVTSGGLPHQVTRDDVYDGYHIPTGANIHPNQWAIHRDPELYPDPETYNPARWLEPGWPTYRAPLSVYPNLQNYSNFGFGRRICVGQNIAERNLMILAARLAWAVDVQAPDGRMPPLYDYHSGFNSYPKRFEVNVEGRGGGRMEVLEREYRLAKENDR